MSDNLSIILTVGLVATAAGLLGPFLVLRRVALTSDAVSHAVLPGIVVIWLIFHTRAPLPVIGGAAVFAILCVLAIDALKGTNLVRGDAAIALVFPALFSVGVLGITRYASDIHLDLDSTIYGEIAFSPSRRCRLPESKSPARSSCFQALRWSTSCSSSCCGRSSKRRPSIRNSPARSAFHRSCSPVCSS